MKNRPGPFAPCMRPRRKMTPRSYSWTILTADAANRNRMMTTATAKYIPGQSHARELASHERTLMTSGPADVRMEPKAVAIELKPPAKTGSSGYRRLPKGWRHDRQVLKPPAPSPKVCPRCGGHLYSDMSDDALTLT